jgi:DNA-binding transcriptional regulator YbjK
VSAISERRERERALRHQLIITAARELAETEGWEAVTTRRLA